MTNESRSRSSESSSSLLLSSSNRISRKKLKNPKNPKDFLTMNLKKVATRGRLNAFRVFRRDHGFSLLQKAHKNRKTKWFLQLRRGTCKSFDKCLKAHVLPLNSWEEPSGKSKKQLTAVFSFDGCCALSTDKRCRKSSWRETNLVKLLPVAPENRGSVYELGCCDVSLEHKEDCLAILAVFWIEIGTNNTPAQCFGSIYRITKQLNIVFCELIPSPSMVACCRLTDRKKFTGDQHCLLVFSKDAQVSAYRVEPKRIEKIEDVFDWFPSLALTNLPGGTLRTSCKICDEYRYSAVGLDTGYLIVSVCMIEGNVILDSVRLRYASPISVVEFLPQVSNNIQRLLISSFMGPAQIWRLRFADDKLTWEVECKFANSQYFDSILSACIYRFYHGCPPVVLLGTFSGRILQYELPPPTKEIQKTAGLVVPCGKPINLLSCHGVFVLKQTGFNEISALTSNGFFVLRENFTVRRPRLTKFAAYWMGKWQNTQIRKFPRKREDYSVAELRRRSKADSDAAEAERQMRPRAGSTVSHLQWRHSDDEGGGMERRRVTVGAKDFREQRAATQSASGSSNGSTSRLRQLDVSVSELYYQDGPSDSPSRNTLSPRVPLQHPQSPLANRSSVSAQQQPPVFFRATSKSLTSPQPRITK